MLALFTLCAVLAVCCVRWEEPRSVVVNDVTPVRQTSSNDARDGSLRSKVEATLRFNRENRLLSVERNAAWQAVHGVVAYGMDLPLGVDGKRVLAVEYLLNGGTMKGWQISVAPVLASTGRPGVKAYVEAGSYVGQGHVDQFLGYMSQVGVPLSQPVVIGDKTLTIEDWARQSQYDVSDNPYREYSWTLIALTNLFPNEPSWVAKDGKTWTLEPLVRFEAQQDLSESPCGGMHRLMGLAHAVRYRKKQSGDMVDGWLLAQQQVNNAIKKIRAYQNSDGSFSSNYTQRPGMSADYSTCISATGHTLEFIAYALEPEQLQEPWVEKAVDRMCIMLDSVAGQDLECGGFYHALAGLRLYAERVYGPAKK